MHRQENLFVSTWLKLFWNDLNARLTMSLSPILSMIKDFLIVVAEAVEFGGPRLSDMCNDLGAILLFSIVGEFLLPCNVKPFNFFVED